MKYDINIRVSNRHVHLTKETYELLFDEELTVKTPLNQIGEFASNQTLTLINGDKVMERVRIVGPFRSYNQIELSKKDARTLGIDAPVRRSGEVEGTPEIVLETSKARVKTNGVIITNRHIHMNPEDAKKYGVVDQQPVQIKIDGPKGGIVDAEIKITDNGYFEAHIDTDDANAFLIEDNDKGTLII